MEDTFIKIGKGEGAGNEKIYKLDPMKKNLIENFLIFKFLKINVCKFTHFLP